MDTDPRFYANKPEKHASSQLAFVLATIVLADFSDSKPYERCLIYISWTYQNIKTLHWLYFHAFLCGLVSGHWNNYAGEHHWIFSTLKGAKEAKFVFVNATICPVCMKMHKELIFHVWCEQSFRLGMYFVSTSDHSTLQTPTIKCINGKC